MSESIRAVERALDVLACFSSHTPELTMTQISELVGINKSTIHRLLATLEKNALWKEIHRAGFTDQVFAFFRWLLLLWIITTCVV